MFTQGNVTVMVRDMGRAVEFYTKTLGLPLKQQYGEHWAEVEAPGLTIGLHPASAKAPPPGAAGALSIGLGVERIDDAVQELGAKGVKFPRGIDADGFVRLAHFTDPDGNPLYLSETAPPAGAGGRQGKP